VSETTQAKPDPLHVLAHLLADYRTGSLATVSAGGLPQASYVPLAVDGTERFLFFVSDLSEHTANLRDSRRASLMLIEDEGRTEQLFARNRATFSGTVEAISRQSDGWDTAARIYGDRFGKFFAMLVGLKDFHMFALVPDDIRLVVGFGAAYQVTGPAWDQLDLLTGR
jgi:putative heme iron utilization protein